MFALTKRRRRILFWVMVAIFIVVTPLVVGYARGYRFDFDLRKVTQVGGIAIETEPDDALVFIDGKYTEDDTPTFIRSLLPQHAYHVRVERAGYLPWEKTLQVAPREVAVARNIILFPTDLEFENILPEIESEFYLAPNGDSLFVASTTSPSVVNVGSKTATAITFEDTARTASIENVSWHENSNTIIFERKARQESIWYTYDLRSQILTNVTRLWESGALGNAEASPAAFLPEALVFHRNNGSRLLALMEGDVYFIDLREQNATLFEVRNVARLYAADGRIFAVTEGDALIETDARGVEIRAYGTLAFTPTGLALAPDKKKLLFHNEGSAGVVWLEDVNGDYTRKQGEVDEILKKANSPLRTVSWHHASGYVIAHLADGTILAAEIDTRDRQNVHRWTLPQATHVQYAPEDGRLFVLEKNRGISRLSKEF